MRQTVKATILQGHQVASGQSKSDVTFNGDGGTIRLQTQEFKKLGLDFEAYFTRGYFSGTLNLSLQPYEVHISKPKHFFQGVRWTAKFDKPGQAPFLENFFVDEAKISFRGKVYEGLLYIPDPATKPGHFQAKTTIEVIAETIPGIVYGDEVTLEYEDNAISLVLPGTRS